MSKQDNSQAAIHSDWSEEPIAPSPFLSLGQMIDGYRLLSDEEKAVFLLATGLMDRPKPNALPALGFAAVPAAVGQGAMPLSGNPSQLMVPPLAVNQPPMVVQGAQASNLAARGQVVSTKDPKTGKVYRVVAPTQRTPEYRGLENNSLRAKQALNAYMQRNGLRFNRETNQVLDNSNQAVTPSQEYLTLVETLKSANQAMARYKSSHPDEFRPPVNKGKGRAGAGPSDTAPATQGGSTSGANGSSAPKGAHQSSQTAKQGGAKA